MTNTELAKRQERAVRETCRIPGTSTRTAYLCRDKPAMKEALREAMERSLPEMISYEAALQDITSASEDAMEGVGAFLEKRKPSWQG